MRNILILFLSMLLNACAVYRYKLNSEEMKIVSRGRHSIGWVTIECSEKNIFVKFDAIEGTRCREFSLKTFSPEHFKEYLRSINGPFKFDTGVIYSVRAEPTGDATGVPIMIMLQSDGSLIKTP